MGLYITKRLSPVILLSSISTFLIVSFALYILNPTEGYEISIYLATPLIFWVAITLGLLNGVFIMALVVHKKIGEIWISLGLFEIIFFNVLVIFLYALRGYVLYLGRGDVGSYVGMALDINKYGNFLSNFYPITSIFISQIGQITNIPIYNISRYLSSIYFIIFILFIYCWSKSIYDNKRFISACTIASTPVLFPYFSTSIYHMLLSVLTIPILFYCIQKGSDIRFRFLAIILILLYPFFHPITTIMVFFYLSTKYIYNVYIRKKKESILLILITFVSFSGWFMSQVYIMQDVERIALEIYGSFVIATPLAQPTTASQTGYYISRLGLTEILKSTLFMTGHMIILYILSLTAIFYLIKNKFDKKLILLGIYFIAGSIFIIFIFLKSNTHTPDRLVNLNPNMIFTPLLTGFLIFRTSHMRKSILLICLIILSSMTSIFSIYQSPIILRPNDQTTVNDITSMKWLLTYRNSNITTTDMMDPLYRYADFIYGMNYEKNNNLYNDIALPDHFGNFINGLFPTKKDRYLVITKYDNQAYTTVWKKADRFNKDDFDILDLTKNMNKIYDSKEVYFYYIEKISISE